MTPLLYQHHIHLYINSFDMAKTQCELYSEDIIFGKTRYLNDAYSFKYILIFLK